MTVLAVASLAAGPLNAGWAGAAWAQGPGRGLGDMLRIQPQRNAPPPPPVARYAAETGPGFVFDRSSGSALLKFEDSNEVWVLQPRPTGRGDVVYVNDAGQMVLRATRLGGLTIFTEATPKGVAASLRGGATPIPADVTMTAQAFVRAMQSTAIRLTRAVRHDATINFDADDVSGPLIAEAFSIAMASIEDLAARDPKASNLARLVQVSVREGPAPGVNFDKGVLRITVTPGLGVAGRPSSERIERALQQ